MKRNLGSRDSTSMGSKAGSVSQVEAVKQGVQTEIHRRLFISFTHETIWFPLETLWDAKLELPSKFLHKDAETTLGPCLDDACIMDQPVLVCNQ